MVMVMVMGMKAVVMGVRKVGVALLALTATVVGTKLCMMMVMMMLLLMAMMMAVVMMMTIL